MSHNRVTIAGDNIGSQHHPESSLFYTRTYRFHEWRRVAVVSQRSDAALEFPKSRSDANSRAALSSVFCKTGDD